MSALVACGYDATLVVNDVLQLLHGDLRILAAGER
jgi:hypothetical protein